MARLGIFTWAAESKNWGLFMRKVLMILGAIGIVGCGTTVRTVTVETKTVTVAGPPTRQPVHHAAPKPRPAPPPATSTAQEPPHFVSPDAHGNCPSGYSGAWEGYPQYKRVCVVAPPVPSSVNGHQVDQSNPYPPCPNGEETSGAHANVDHPVYCLVAQQTPPPTTSTPTSSPTTPSGTPEACQPDETPINGGTQCSAPSGSGQPSQPLPPCPVITPATYLPPGTPGKCSGIAVGQTCC